MRKTASVALLILLALTMLVPTASALGLERPGGYVLINQRTENSKTDGRGSVGLGVHIEEYYENAIDHPSYGNDYVKLRVSANANTRKILSYTVFSDDSYYLWHDNLPHSLSLDNDDCAYISTWPLTVRFYGGPRSAEYTSVYVTSNGVVSFDPTESTTDKYYSHSIPDTAGPNTFVAPFWKDLNPLLGGSITYGVVTHQTWSGPTTTLCISWNDIYDKYFQRQSFQVLIEDAPLGWSKLRQSRIWFQYKTITLNDPQTVVGIEDQQGGKGTSYNYLNLGNSTVIQFEQASNSALIGALTIRLNENDAYAYTMIEEQSTAIRGYNVILDKSKPPDPNEGWVIALKGASTLMITAYLNYIAPGSGLLFGVLWIGLNEVGYFAQQLRISELFATDNYQTYATAHAADYDSGALYISDAVDASFDILAYWIFTELDTQRRTHNLNATAELTYYEYDISNNVVAGPTITTSVELSMSPDNNNDFDTAQQAEAYMNTIYLGGYDAADYYKFNITSLFPGYPSYRIFTNATVRSEDNLWLNLSIYDPSHVLKNSTGYGSQESVTYITSTIGLWFIKVASAGLTVGYYNITIWVSPWPPGSPGACPILYVYDGSDYMCEGLLGIHNPNATDVIANHTLATTPANVNGAYLMRLTEHPKTISHIDQVKLYVTLKSGITVQLPLIYAWHSEDGNVLLPLLFSDNWRTITKGANWNNGTSQSMDLKFLALPPYIEVTAFTFQIEGYNPYVK